MRFFSPTFYAKGPLQFRSGWLVFVDDMYTISGMMHFKRKYIQIFLFSLCLKISSRNFKTSMLKNKEYRWQLWASNVLKASALSTLLTPVPVNLAIIGTSAKWTEDVKESLKFETCIPHATFNPYLGLVQGRPHAPRRGQVRRPGPHGRPAAARAARGAPGARADAERSHSKS